MRKPALFILLIPLLTGICLADIITTDSWDQSDPAQWVAPFGESQANSITCTSTYGQSFRIQQSDQNILNSISFYMKYLPAYYNTDQIDFSVHVFEWGGDRIVGDALFSSDEITLDYLADVTKFSVNTNDISLKAGTDYIWFATTLNHFDGEPGSAWFGARWDNPYADGKFYFMNDYTGFSCLYDQWSNAGQWKYFNDVVDLACEMKFSESQPVGVPEPSSGLNLVMGLIGLSLVGFLQRTRKLNNRVV
jgi:hypothetical protein